MGIDLGRTPNEATMLTGVSVVGNFSEVSFIDMPFTTLGAVQDDGDSIPIVSLTFF